MSFKVTKPIHKSDILYYSYPKTAIRGGYAKNLSTDGYIQAPFKPEKNESNISCSLFDSDYSVTNIYVSKKIHDLIGMTDYDGVLILEHKPMTNGFKPLYTCFPLKTKAGLKTDIDLLINNEKNIGTLPIELQIKTESNRCLVYESPGYIVTQQVVIFVEPILVGSDFSKFVTVDLFKPSATNYDLITCKNGLNPERKVEIKKEDNKKTTSVKDPVIENFEDGVVASAYCQPIDEVDPDLEKTVNLEVPLMGKYSLDDSMNSLNQVALHFAMYTIFALIVFFGIDKAYASFILFYIKNYSYGGEGDKELQNKLNRVKSVDYFVSMLSVVTIFSYLMYGAQVKNGFYMTMAFLFFIFFVIGVCRIYYYKMNRQTFGHDIFLKEGFPDDAKFKDLMSASKSDFFDFLTDNFMYIGIVGIIGTVVITMIVGGILAAFTTVPSVVSLVLGVLISYVVIVWRFNNDTERAAPGKAPMPEPAE